jgi:hypothetical protein
MIDYEKKVRGPARRRKKQRVASEDGPDKRRRAGEQKGVSDGRSGSRKRDVLDSAVDGLHGETCVGRG